MIQPIHLPWRGGDTPFRVALGELRQIETDCDAGPATVLERLTSGAWRVEDVVSPIRNGLMGGGMDRREARRLAGEIGTEAPIGDHVSLAAAIMAAALYGAPDDVPGKSEPTSRVGTATTSPTDDGAGAAS